MRNFTKLLLLCSAIAVTGCASTATGVKQSVFQTSNQSQKAVKTLPSGTVMAVVRYPAHIEPQAEDAFYDAYSTNVIGGSTPKNLDGSPEMQALADTMILKSNYFALSLYKELAARLPAHNVLLSPHSITLDAAGNLTSEPLTQAESLPNIVTVDFASYTFPDTKKMMGKEPLTFGDLVTPIVTVRTDHRAAVPTQGLLMASTPILGRAAGNGRDAANDSLDVLQSGRFADPVSELDFIAFLKGDTPLDVASQSVRSAAPNSVVAYPIEKIKLDGDVLESMNAADAGVVDPLKPAFSAGFANQIIGIINRTDIDKASMAGRASAISQFDESLAALTLVGSEDADYQARYRYAERLLEAEQKYLSVQSLRLFDGVHNGEMGAQVRVMLEAEYDVLEKRRKLARQQNAATALGVLAAVAAGGAISSQDGSGGIVDRLAIEALIAGTIYAGRTAISSSKRSKALGANYLSAVAPALDEQQSVQINLIDSNETITAIRFEDLREKLQVLYNEKQRSLDTVATRCGYTHDGTVKSGTWLGVCENGLANGSGVGVLRNADGSSVEYYGYAQNGQPEGPGYMITHTPSGSSAIEGNFSSGLANGAMRVSKTGQPDKVMTYQAGQQTGRASSGTQVASPFVAMPDIAAAN